MTPTPPWLLLVLSLPAAGATARMRTWRALKSLGCAALRDGAYLAPFAAERDALLRELSTDTVREGGSAWLLAVTAVNEADEQAYRALFDRRGDYADFLTSLTTARQSISGLGVQELNRIVRKLRKEFEAIRLIDFFPNDASTHAQVAWDDFVNVAEASSAGEPKPRAGAIVQLDASVHQNRSWATRRRPWVDRVASAWLIRRFIDCQARFIWLESPDDCPADALGFDFDGAAFSHVGERVTFEVLLESFGLNRDAALMRLGQLVHALDVGGPSVPEAGGFEAMLDGARRRIADDDALLAHMGTLLDSLYEHYVGAAAPDTP